MVGFCQGMSLISNMMKTMLCTSARRTQRVTSVYVNTIRNVSERTVNTEHVHKETTEETMAWELLVNYSKLSPQDLKIHQRHADAVRNKKLTYIDPSTGYIVMTRLSHLTRGECCGNACRHCPYGQKSVPDNQKKTFNSAFYV